MIDPNASGDELPIRGMIAAMAMQGMLANNHPDQKICARQAVQMADALIAELNRTPYAFDKKDLGTWEVHKEQS